MRARRVAAALALILVPMLAMPVRAAEPAPLPAEPGARVLDGDVVTATTGDIDGDGVADLVRIVRSDTNPTLLAVDAWSVDEAGSWTHHEQVPLRRETSVDRQLSGLPRPDADGMLPVLFGESVGFLRAGTTPLGGERVMVAAIGTRDEEPACCLTLWEVEARSGVAESALTLRLALALGRGAFWAAALKLDIAGPSDYDELLVGAYDATAKPTLTVLRWTSGGFREVARRTYPRDASMLTWEGTARFSSSAGQCASRRIPEAAVLVTPFDDENSGASLMLLGLMDGQLTEEVVRVENVPGVDADGVLSIDGRLWVWWGWQGFVPPAADPLALAFGGNASTPFLVAGGDADAMETAIMDECYTDIAAVSAGRVAARFRGLMVRNTVDPVSLSPYRGEIPSFGEYDDAAGVIIDGTLLTMRPGGEMEVSNSAVLAGMAPIGLVGPNGSWMAITDMPGITTPNRPFTVSFYQHVDTGRISVAPVEQVLSQEAGDGTFLPRLVGAVPDPAGGPDGLLTGAAGFRAEVEVPPGSRLFVTPLAEGLPIDPSWDGRADDGHAVLQVAVPAGSDTFRVRAVVVTPAGHGYIVAWRVRVLREPPPMQVEADWAALAFDVPVRGSTDPMATVLVDGAPVPVAADGTFAARAAAPPWPTTVVVEAVDLVGNRTTTTLTVVGLLDYRQLPWVPIIVALTVVAAAGLFLLAPRLKPPSVTPHPDDGTLEDLDER